MAILANCQLLLQTVLYFVISLSGFVAVVPLGLTSADFKGNCILYGTSTWVNSTYFTTEFGSKVTCNFELYIIAFTCVIFGIIMGSYYTLALCRTRNDPTIPSQMWVMPFIMVNALICVTLFVSSCIVSVGFKYFCDSLVNGALDQGRKDIKKCIDAETRVKIYNKKDPSIKFDNSTFFHYLTVSQTASWICFLLFLTQLSLGVLRLYRNRRGRSAGQIQENPDMSSDKQTIANVEPSA